MLFAQTVFATVLWGLSPAIWFWPGPLPTKKPLKFGLTFRLVRLLTLLLWFGTLASCYSTVFIIIPILFSSFRRRLPWFLRKSNEGFVVLGGDRFYWPSPLGSSSCYRFIVFVLTPHLQRVAIPQSCSPSHGTVGGNQLVWCWHSLCLWVPEWWSYSGLF